MGTFVYIPIPRLSEAITVRIERHFVYCPVCQQHTTVDFAVEQFDCEGAKGRTITNYIEYRSESGALNYRAFVSACPRCGERNITRKQLKRKKLNKNHPCGEKCRKAVSEECACSCAGLNHGIANKKYEEALTLF